MIIRLFLLLLITTHLKLWSQPQFPPHFEVVAPLNITAIYAKSENVFAVSAVSTSGYAIHGYSQSNIGVYGISSSNFAVFGQSISNSGAYFKGADGFASIVLGGSNYIGGDDDGVIMSDPTKPGSDIVLVSNDAVVIKLDNDNNEVGQFEIRKGNNEVVYSVDEAGNVKLNGTTIHSSDRNRKTNFQAVETGDILNRLCAIPIQKWNYKDDGMPHIGPMAQDFYSAFNVGLDDKTICAVDADGVLMAAVQALAQENQMLKEQLSGLEQKVNLLIQQTNVLTVQEEKY